MQRSVIGLHPIAYSVIDCMLVPGKNTFLRHTQTQCLVELRKNCPDYGMFYKVNQTLYTVNIFPTLMIWIFSINYEINSPNIIHFFKIFKLENSLQCKCIVKVQNAREELFEPSSCRCGYHSCGHRSIRRPTLLWPTHRSSLNSNIQWLPLGTTQHRQVISCNLTVNVGVGKTEIDGTVEIHLRKTHTHTHTHWPAHTSTLM